MRYLHFAALTSLLALTSACSSNKISAGADHAQLASSRSDAYLSSGTIILSANVPKARLAATVGNTGTGGTEESPYEGIVQSRVTESSAQLAPLLGYFPPASEYTPASNESWIRVNTEKLSIELLRGQNVLFETVGEGKVSLAPGKYYLQQKKEQPLWYASDKYFLERAMQVPAADSSDRLLRGALGQLAMYPSPNFAIHSGIVWTEAVGGLKITEEDLKVIFRSIELGAPVVVR